jgi:hypothetical protein
MRPDRCNALLDSALSTEHGRELFDGDACLADERSKSAFGELTMIGDRKAAKGRLAMPEDDVAALLAVDVIAEPTKGGDCFATGDPR